MSYIKGETFFIYQIFSSPRSTFLDEKETDFPFDIFLLPRYNVRVFSFLQSTLCQLLLNTASASCILQKIRVRFP